MPHRLMHAWCVLAIVLGFLLTGCQGPEELEPMPPALSLEELLQHFNDNVASIEPFSASVQEWKVQFIDDKDKKQSHSDILGKLFYVPPSEGRPRPWFYFQAGVLLESQALVLGSNDDEFWFYSKVMKGGAWARHEDAMLGIYGSQVIYPFAPTELLELIGLYPIPDNLKGSPYPAIKIGTDKYEVNYLIVDNGTLKVSRQIDFDRRSALPTLVKEYNNNSECYRITHIYEYAQLGDVYLPRHFRLEVPSVEAVFEVKLNNFRVDTKDRHPLFERPKNVPGVDSFKQLQPPSR